MEVCKLPVLLDGAFLETTYKEGLSLQPSRRYYLMQDEGLKQLLIDLVDGGFVRKEVDFSTREVRLSCFVSKPIPPQNKETKISILPGMNEVRDD